MIAPTWALYIDVDRDGVTDSSENIIADVLAIEAWLGFDDPIQRVAPPPQMRVLVNNTLFDYNPEREVTVTAGRFIYLHGSSALIFDAVVWTGTIVRFEGSEQAGTSWIICEGRWAGAGAQVDVAVYPSTDAGTVLYDVLAAGYLQQPIGGEGGTAGTWMLDVVDQAELGQNTVVGYDLYNYIAVDDGDTELTYVGRDFNAPTVAEVTDALMRAEWGRFYQYHDDSFVFRARHLTTALGSPYEFTDADKFIVTDYQYADLIINEVVINLTAYVVAEDQVIWTSTVPIPFPPGDTEMKLRFLAADGRTVYLAGDISLSGFVFKTGSVSGLVVSPLYSCRTAINGGILQVSNKRGARIWLQVGAQITADIVTQETPAQQVIRNLESINRYGVRSLPLNMPSFADIDAVIAVAQFITWAYSQPIGRFKEIVVTSDSNESVFFQFNTLYSLVRITAPNVGQDQQDYYITRIHYDIRPGKFTTTMRLEPFFEFWHVENFFYGYLEETTRVGY